MVLLFAALDARVRRWQLPTYNGTKSYQNLLVEVYGMVTATGGSTYRINVDSQLQLDPFDFVDSGYYSCSSGYTNLRNGGGGYWQLNAYTEPYSRDLLFYSTYLNPQYVNEKGYGMALRCLVR